MACACKVNQEIDKIHKYYSYNGKTKDENRQKMSINHKDAAITALIYVLLLPTLPFIFLYLFFFGLFSKNKMISIRKFFNFIHKTRNGRKQQII